MLGMKRFLAVVLLVIVALFVLVGCSKTGDCESCGSKNVSLEKVEANGKSAYVCETCADLINGLKDVADGLTDMFK